MSYIRKLDNKEFLYHHEIRSAYPDIDFPEIITDDLLLKIGIQLKEIEKEDVDETIPVDALSAGSGDDSLPEPLEIVEV